MNQRRVVITGMGTVNPLGNSVEQTWEALLAGRSGIGPITRFDASHLPTQIAGEVKDFDYRDYFSGDLAKKAKRMAPFCHYAAAATREAALQAGLETIKDKSTIGISYGSGVGGLGVQHENSLVLKDRGHRRVSPFYVPMSIGNIAAGVLSMIWGVTGPNISLQTACASANHAIATAFMVLRSGMAEVMIAGGSEGALIEISIAGFGNMQALSTRNDSPETASRPYDTDRDGFVLSEGGATLILEDYDHARRRGAPILAEVLSCGMSGDACDLVAPDPQGRGAALSMKMALNQAGVSPGDLGYINTHGTSTPVGDIAELRGIAEALGDAADVPLVGSTKSYHGHLLGAAAGLEAVITTQALREQVVPANLNLDTPDPELPPLQLPRETVKASFSRALSNSFGFGGHNSSLLLGTAPQEI
ncbi:beta-ketoacyl-[acyl-carrier-protein] synthase II [Alkalispirochaeta sphaeroplastigenens]|uniref:3-oxoacyl-[acyl-carrier-protein] synthase 2 n=1 Tax=Alkalispirochaeta sphaeroplastigenens TaxID=1187066 RepID=A0A2S4JRE2_9SPIO|nr:MULTISPECIES: beta-ketoacyl-ACP synthase II [Alkalispirochaeta]POR02062.1 beta-ketoacyl-[acyl-carrier-protein] synthase II [Alkalispirochaeta sphaeroplastigenens]